MVFMVIARFLIINESIDSFTWDKFWILRTFPIAAYPDATRNVPQSGLHAAPAMAAKLKGRLKQVFDSVLADTHTTEATAAVIRKFWRNGQMHVVGRVVLGLPIGIDRYVQSETVKAAQNLVKCLHVLEHSDLDGQAQLQLYRLCGSLKFLRLCKALPPRLVKRAAVLVRLLL